MTPERWQKVRELFHAVLELDGSQRASYLDEQCSGDPSLRREVESLISSHGRADSFLEHPAAAGGVLKSGTKLGPYEILGPLGAGGMGEVYRARDTRLERDVAVKVLSPGMLADEAARRRFRNEALALAKLNHPNIGGIYEFERQGDLDFLVMEYVPGTTLAERLIEGALPEKEVTALGIQIAGALEEAHEHGLVHRDLKPGNVVITPKGQAKVLDFGLARLLRPVSKTADASQALTETHLFSGTLPYMAPEQLRGEPADARTDIHAAGAVLYEMATGQRPFAQQGQQLVAAILHEVPRPPSSVNRRVSPGLESVIVKALDKEPENRYQSAKELGVDLRRLALPSSATTVRVVAREHRFRWAALGVGLAALLLLAIVLGFNVGGWRDRLLGRPAPESIRSIAVLPLENLSGDPAQEYFADGMTEALITDLGKIGTLRLISRTSAMHYKGTRKTLPEIARELNVDAVVEGAVLRSGDRVRITAQLIRTASDQHLWAEEFQGQLRDVLALQSQVARAIAAQVRVKLTQQQMQSASTRTINPEAYEYYLKGCYSFWTRWSREGYNNAIQYFEMAIEKDPNYAAPYAGLARCYTAGSFRGQGLPPREGWSKAAAAAKKALELDDQLGEAHIAMAVVRFRFDWNWPEAEREYKRGLELRPNDALGHASYSWFLGIMGRLNEAMAEATRARELDPLSPLGSNTVGLVYAWSRRWDEAIAEYRRTLQLDPNFITAHAALASNYEEKGMYAQAVDEELKVHALIGHSPEQIESLRNAFAASGIRGFWEKSLEWEKRQLNQPRPPYLVIARLCVRLGRRDEAFHWLEKAYDTRYPFLPDINIVAWTDPIRSDPRFADLLRRIGLPP